jgi:hypothetical protein
VGLAEEKEMMKKNFQILSKPFKFLSRFKLLLLIALYLDVRQILSKISPVHRLYIYKNKITEYSGLVLNTGKEGEACL